MNASMDNTSFVLAQMDNIQSKLPESVNIGIIPPLIIGGISFPYGSTQNNDNIRIINGKKRRRDSGAFLRRHNAGQI